MTGWLYTPIEPRGPHFTPSEGGLGPLKALDPFVRLHPNRKPDRRAPHEGRGRGLPHLVQKPAALAFPVPHAGQ
jgi:hypothetical protein